MNTDRIKQIQKETGYPESVSVQQALLKVWNECGLETEQLKKQLEDKEKEVERLNDELKLNRADAIKYKQDFDEKCCTVANLADDVEQLQSQLSEKDKELSELKAKHKECLDALINIENDDNSIPYHAWNLIKTAIKNG